MYRINFLVQLCYACTLFVITLWIYEVADSVLLFYGVHEYFSILWDIFQYHRSC